MCVQSLKLLAKRLGRVLGKVIDERQSAFFVERFMLDGVMVTNEVVDEVKKDKNKQCVIFKMDFEKAYDFLSWDFLYYMLRKLGFCEVWIKWMKACRESASLLVLVNGHPIKEFRMHRGLRQGVPLSPFLFLYVVEGLACLMREVKAKQMFEGVKVGKKQV